MILYSSFFLLTCFTITNMNSRQENITRIPEIILKKLKRKATDEELHLLNEWLSMSEKNRTLYKKLVQRENLVLIKKQYQKINNEAAWEEILRKIELKKKTPVRKLYSKAIKYAAILALPIMVASFFLYRSFNYDDPTSTFIELEMQISELKESSLITDEGEVVSLQLKNNETVVEIDGTEIHKKDSTLLYNARKKKVEEVKYNSLVTPRSKVYSVVLADGTKVWLNASSAIKYPVYFTGKTRKVFLIGEAYFEVKRDTTHPFIVSTNKMEVEVLGTSFNVMAYPEDKVAETTLVSGKVNVKTDANELILEPGMTAQLNKTNNLLNQTKTDTELITSWRFGKYIFKYENLESVMAKLSRWYNVDVSFVNAEKKNIHFSGTLHKYNDINETLHIIELATDVSFENSENFISVN